MMRRTEAAQVHAGGTGRRAGTSGRRRGPPSGGRLVELAVLIVLAIVIIFPVWFMATTALKTTRETFAIPPAIFFWPTFDHFAQIFADGAVVGALTNSLIVASGSTLLALILGAPAAYALARVDFKGKSALWFWFISNRFISPIVVAIPFFLLMRNVGLIDSQAGLILVYLIFNVPLVIWLCTDHFRAVPAELDDAAYVDGAGPYRTFVTVVLPLAAPGIAVAAILSFVFSWNEFIFALVLTRSDAVTAPVEAAGFMTGYGVQWGPMMATGTLIVLPVVVFAALASRHLVHGLTMGSVRG